ncbi:hypothetical protein, partial [Aphanizomenon flos-aquae]|uniref:hypothetical protein n=1 Tax=Aphanizomenon flos-aquae TaxID=1176 RepID=UPI001F48A4BF
CFKCEGFIGIVIGNPFGFQIKYFVNCCLEITFANSVFPCSGCIVNIDISTGFYLANSGGTQINSYVARNI